MNQVMPTAGTVEHVFANFVTRRSYGFESE
jgi:hypothetical protein